MGFRHEREIYDGSSSTTTQESCGSPHDDIRAVDYVISPSGIVYYLVDITCSYDKPLDTYTIKKRYSDFKQLYRDLQNALCDITPSFLYRFSSVGTEGSLSEEKADGIELPKLPTGGIMSYFTKHKPAMLSYRMQQFNRILEVARTCDLPNVQDVLHKFIQEAPDTEQKYTSLNDYALTEMRLSVEREERRRAASFVRYSLSMSEGSHLDRLGRRGSKTSMERSHSTSI